MTPARQERKTRCACPPTAIPAAAVAFFLMAPILAPVTAATTERIVTNRHTGLAMHGFDPVSYFVGPVPAVGRPHLEWRHAGVTWRFHNEGNRAAFAAHPGVYMPQLGGYDPMAVARGAAAPGDPTLWAVVSGRLFLFHSERSRGMFMADPEAAMGAAERRWPEVLRTLVP